MDAGTNRLPDAGICERTNTDEAETLQSNDKAGARKGDAQTDAFGRLTVSGDSARTLERTMNKAQSATLSFAFMAIFAVNFPYVLPRYYKGSHRPVGSPTVKVHVPASDSAALTVPVIEPTDGFRETGQRVSVYLRNGYRDDEIQFAPRLTLSLLLGFGVLYVIITRITTRPPAPTPR